jgi:calcineurin-like phosphoesterase family protein
LIWLIADTHFGHTKLCENWQRPLDYEERIIKNWNNQVKYDDVVIILGDISWSGNLDVFQKLKGRKILVRGNHDKKGIDAYLNHFDFACDRIAMRYMGHSIVFSHKPLDEFKEDLNIFGHLHNFHPHELIKGQFCISLEDMGYTVFSLPSIINRAIKKWSDR